MNYFMTKRLLNRSELVLIKKGMISCELAKSSNKSECTIPICCTNDRGISVEIFCRVIQFFDADILGLFTKTKTQKN